MKKAINRNCCVALLSFLVVIMLTVIFPVSAQAATKKTTIKTINISLANSNKSYFAVPKVKISNKGYVKGNITWNVKAKVLKQDRKERDIEAKMYVIAKNGYKFTKKVKVVFKGFNKQYSSAKVQYLDQAQVLVTLKTKSCIKPVNPQPTQPTDGTDDGVIAPYLNPFAHTDDPFFFIYYNGNWYYTNGVAYKTGWVYKYNNYYYFDKKSGKMLVNCTVEIDGKMYTFNDQGVMIRFR